LKLQTNIPLEAAFPQIDYGSDVLLLGSCFTANIGGKLDYFKFRNKQNPFGIIFHPIAIHRLIDKANSGKMFTEKELFQQQGLWHSLQVHSLIHHSDKQFYLDMLNDLLVNLKQAIETASHIIITYGTAWGYRHLGSDAIVANCHKVPQKEFHKELSTVEAIAGSLRASLNAIRSVNDKVTIILTVSPVRHIKDGFVENSRSKAHLIAAVHQVISETEGLNYFPAYEIMMDELRDYRFYSEDMLHPNDTAITLIWEKFTAVWISAQTNTLRQEIAEIQLAMQHRPFNPESQEHQKFLALLQDKKAAVQKKLPHVHF
jgi:hypothetical protein